MGPPASLLDGYRPAKPAADQAFGMAGMERGAIDVCSFYDCFTITVLATLEDTGFAPKGQGGPWVADPAFPYLTDRRNDESRRIA